MSVYYPREARCKICMNILRDEIDRMLLHDELHPEGRPYKYEEIVAWCAGQGLETSMGGLSRHRNHHLQPALQAALETEKLIEAISNATGKKMSVQHAVVNVIATKALKLLNDLDFSELKGEKVLEVIVRSVDAAAKLARVEQFLNKETAKEVGEKLKGHGLSEEVIREIEEQILGLQR
jgi:hypothetical protein